MNRKVIAVKLNIGEINDLLITYKPQAISMMKLFPQPKHDSAMKRLIIKLESAEIKLKKKMQRERRNKSESNKEIKK